MSQPIRLPLRALAPCIKPRVSLSRSSFQAQLSLQSTSQPNQQYSTTSARPILQHATAPFPLQIRRASSAPSSQSPSFPSSSPSSQVLPWNDFFKLRQRRRYYNLVSSIATAGSSLFVGISYFSAQGADMLAFTGLDPLVSLPLMSFACGVGGWLAGPAIGSAMFRLTNRGASGMNAKERNFYARIKKYRIDPSSSSMQNPVPDYYGEKITSVQGYRQWLKDQRAFNKKRQSFL